MVCPVLQPSGESRVEVLDFNVHPSRARTTAEKLAATRLGIDPEQPPSGAHVVCEPSPFPAGLVFAKEVVTSLPYYSVPAPGQREPYVGYMIDEQRLLGLKVRSFCCLTRMLQGDWEPLWLTCTFIFGFGSLVIRPVRLLTATWATWMFTRFEWARCMSACRHGLELYPARGETLRISPECRTDTMAPFHRGLLPRCPFIPNIIVAMLTLSSRISLFVSYFYASFSRLLSL